VHGSPMEAAAMRGLCAAMLLLCGPMPLAQQGKGKGLAKPEPLLTKAAEWDHLGDFKLQDRGGERPLKLYSSELGSRLRKAMGKRGIEVWFSPNFLTLHAFYQDGSGKWQHQELYSGGRLRFLGVVRAGPDAIVLQLRPDFRIMLEPGERGQVPE